MKYCRGLNFEETPDYVYLKGLFKTMFDEMKLIDDGYYSWVRQKDLNIEKRISAE